MLVDPPLMEIIAFFSSPAASEVLSTNFCSSMFAIRSGGIFRLDGRVGGAGFSPGLPCDLNYESKNVNICTAKNRRGQVAGGEAPDADEAGTGLRPLANFQKDV